MCRLKYGRDLENHSAWKKKKETTRERKPAFILCLVLNWIQRVAGLSSGSQCCFPSLCKYRLVKSCAACMKYVWHAPYPVPYISGAFPAGPECLRAVLPVPDAPGWMPSRCIWWSRAWSSCLGEGEPLLNAWLCTEPLHKAPAPAKANSHGPIIVTGIISG